MRRRWPISGIAAVIVVFVACGNQIDTNAPESTHPDAGSPLPDASTNDGGDIAEAGFDDASDDAAQPGPPCDLDAEFLEPKPVLGIQGVETMFISSMTADERTLYFDSVPGSVSQVYRAQRNSRTDAFGPRVLVPALSNGSTGRLALSGDGLTIAFYTDQAPPGLRIATRTSLSDEFMAQNIKTPSFLTAHGSVQVGAFSYDGLTLYYQAIAANVGVFASTKKGDDFPPGVLVPGLTTLDNPPHVSRDGSIAYLTHGSPPDIYRSKRAAKGGFTTPVPESSVINTPSQEIVCFVSWDGCRLYFSRRSSGLDATLLVAEKPLKK